MIKHTIGLTIFTGLIFSSPIQATNLNAPNAVRELNVSQMADGYLRHGSSPTGHGSTTELRGYYSSQTKMYTPELVFVLPNLNGETISSANLSAHGTRLWPHNIYNTALDLYGVMSVENTASNIDTEINATDAANSAGYAVAGNNGVGIMDNFFPLSSKNNADGTYQTDGAADQALGEWLQAQYNAGAQAGDYVFLRLTPDTTPIDGVFYRGWIITPADAASNQPQLTITTSPGGGSGGGASVVFGPYPSDGDADRSVSSGTSNSGSYTYAGTTSPASINYAAVFAYQITANITSSDISSALLKITLHKNNGLVGAADLEALRVSTSANITSADYSASGTMIDAGFIPLGASPGPYQVDSPNFGTWLKNNNASQNDYVILRIKPQSLQTTTYDYLRFYDSQENTLSITTGSAPAPPSSSSTIIQNGISAESGNVNKAGTINTGIPYSGVAGSTADNNSKKVAVFVFQLPALGALGTVSDASFSTILTTNKKGTSGLLVSDLYAIRQSTSPDIVASDYYMGASDSSANVTKLVDSFVDNNDANGATISSGSNSSLVSWLQSQYDASASAGDYVFFRINPNANWTTPYDFHVFDDAESQLTVAIDSQTSGTANQVSKDSITWFFDDTHTYGTFANGDIWVVGPVTITAISPAATTSSSKPATISATRYINGSVINPEIGTTNGYDSALYAKYSFDNVSNPTSYAYYDDSLNIARQLPYTVAAGNSVISTKTFENYLNRPGIKSASVLTVLASAPATGSFRPPYIGSGNKSIDFNISQISTKLTGLPTLAIPVGAPDLAAITDKFRRVRLEDTIGGVGDYSVLNRYGHPADNMENYGGDIAQSVADAALSLCMNYSTEQKKELAIGLIQYGIDLYGLIEEGAYWNANGGIHQGRKLAILFAGYMLNNSDMLNIENDYPLRFQEDTQTFYVPSSHVGMFVGEKDPALNPYINWEYYFGDRAINLPHRVHFEYLSSDEQLPEWGINHDRNLYRDNSDFFATYRTIVSNPMSGQMLAVHILALTDEWAGNSGNAGYSLLDYCDRYMQQVARFEAQPESEQDAILAPYIAKKDVSYTNFPAEYIKEMWATHRVNYTAIPRVNYPDWRYIQWENYTNPNANSYSWRDTGGAHP